MTIKFNNKKCKCQQCKYNKTKIKKKLQFDTIHYLIINLAKNLKNHIQKH